MNKRRRGAVECENIGRIDVEEDVKTFGVLILLPDWVLHGKIQLPGTSGDLFHLQRALVMF